jgi:hypothetical protein
MHGAILLARVALVFIEDESDGHRLECGHVNWGLYVLLEVSESAWLFCTRHCECGNRAHILHTCTHCYSQRVAQKAPGGCFQLVLLSRRRRPAMPVHVHSR